eukprot:COSAG01_NODE_3643_length_5811_cov_7.353967_6_plen_108_part_00
MFRCPDPTSAHTRRVVRAPVRACVRACRGAVAQAMPMQQPAMQMMQVTCPQGVGPGQPIMIQGPGGGNFQVFIPPPPRRSSGPGPGSLGGSEGEAGADARVWFVVWS